MEHDFKYFFVCAVTSGVENKNICTIGPGASGVNFYMGG